MSQSPTAAGALRFADETPREETIANQETAQDLLDAFHDPDCRAILDATTGQALSATEISETCDLPLSTAYRKLDLLSETEVLAERTRIRQSGKHASEYVCRVEDVTIAVTDEGAMELTVTRREDAPAPTALLS
jgi:hypothetical protein